MTTHKLFTIIFCALYAIGMTAQTNGSSSSYSRFGLGLLSDQSQGYNRSMGGVGQGLRAGHRVNALNPASYAAIDSLSFLFDAGMSLQRTTMSVGSSRQNVNNTAIEYVNAGFRLLPHLGMSIGFMPYTNIGYSFTQERSNEVIDPYTLQNISSTYTYNGEGGLHQGYVGIGWEPFKNFSIGTNISFLWGNINNQMVQTFSENGVTSSSNYSSLSTYYKSMIQTWKADIGVQYQYSPSSMNRLTLGATIGIGHKIGSEASMERMSQSGDTISASCTDAFQLPMTYSIGAAWEHKDKLTLAADFTLEQWSKCTTPQIATTTTGGINYLATKGIYADRYRVNIGAEFVPGRFDRTYLHRINYRFGLSYSSPYLKVNGHDGPKEYSVTAGVGIPITNGWSNRAVLNIYKPSYINVGIQWTRRDASASSLIDENIFRINIGLSFNERWFMKWKFQ